MERVPSDNFVHCYNLTLDAAPGHPNGLTMFFAAHAKSISGPTLHRLPIRPRATWLVAELALALAGCGAADKPKETKTPEVGFVIVHPTSASLVSELPGRVSALQTAEVRPQITGVVHQRLFTEGAIVHRGQPLYRIDSSLYRAAAAQAAANLAAAQATASASGTKAARYAPLAAAQAVSQQDYTDAAAAARAANASVAQNRAALEIARINVRFTTVPAPITGRIGRSLFTQGALVTANQAGPLAVISVLDPVYVDIQQSASDQLRLRKALASNGAAPLGADVRLLLDDGSEYDATGHIEFSEVTVDSATGTVTMRVRIPNPQNLLLPGMFVRARFSQGSQANVFLVPQEAVTRDPRGAARVLVIGPDGKAQSRDVVTDRTQGADWVVTRGLREGEKVITQGLGKAKPGMPVKAVPASAAQAPRNPDAKASGAGADGAR